MSFSSGKDKKKEEPTEEEQVVAFLSELGAGESGTEVRAMGIYGEINEETCFDALSSILRLENSGRHKERKDPNDEESELVEVYDPFDFYVSTFGGSALDMFAIYDLMKKIRGHCAINTIGLGKVMSAGVLLLAAGTKGHRQVGQNCRLMIHGVISGQHGHIHNLENEMEEARWTQKQFIKALSKESNMTQKEVKKLMDRKLNVYFDADEALKMGIVDEII